MSATPPDPVPLGAPAAATPEAPCLTRRQRIGQALRSVAGRLTLVTLGFCIVFTALAGAVRTWAAWNNGVAWMASDLKMLEEVFQPGLARSVWELDREAVLSQISGLLGAKAVGMVELTVGADTRGRQPETFGAVRPGWRLSGLAPTRTVALVHEPFVGRQETVGTLTLYGEERALWSRLRDELRNIVVTQLTQSLLLAGLVMLVFNRLVTQHVRRIAAHLKALSPETLDQPLVLKRTPSRRDELTQLVDGVNQLQTNLSDFLQRQHRDETELAHHRDRLAELVQARTLELEAANRRLETLSRTDALTGLANRRHFDEAATREFARCGRGGHPLCLLLADVDHFKRFNDTYGHANGDACLRAVAAALQRVAARPTDLAARVGGEEFALLLPDTPLEQATRIAHLLRDMVHALAITHAGAGPGAAPYVTLSIGVAPQEPAMPDVDRLFRHADRAMYQAKEQGRNRVVAAL